MLCSQQTNVPAQIALNVPAERWPCPRPLDPHWTPNRNEILAKVTLQKRVHGELERNCCFIFLFGSNKKKLSEKEQVVLLVCFFFQSKPQVPFMFVHSCNWQSSNLGTPVPCFVLSTKRRRTTGRQQCGVVSVTHEQVVAVAGRAQRLDGLLVRRAQQTLPVHLEDALPLLQPAVPRHRAYSLDLWTTSESISHFMSLWCPFTHTTCHTWISNLQIYLLPVLMACVQTLASQQTKPWRVWCF